MKTNGEPILTEPSAEEIAAAEAWLDELDPDTTPAEDPADLRAIAEAVEDLHAAEERIEAAVAAARASGRPWGLIGFFLGVSRQAAHERFSKTVGSG